ncbi:1736_t:CDS:2, partial [Dentiscutata erythropus]
CSTWPGGPAFIVFYNDTLSVQGGPVAQLLFTYVGILFNIGVMEVNEFLLNEVPKGITMRKVGLFTCTKYHVRTKCFIINLWPTKQYRKLMSISIKQTIIEPWLRYQLAIFNLRFKTFSSSFYSAAYTLKITN